jgi:hypothetical protein
VPVRRREPPSSASPGARRIKHCYRADDVERRDDLRVVRSSSGQPQHRASVPTILRMRPLQQAV